MLKKHGSDKTMIGYKITFKTVLRVFIKGSRPQLEGV